MMTTKLSQLPFAIMLVLATSAWSEEVVMPTNQQPAQQQMGQMQQKQQGQGQQGQGLHLQGTCLEEEGAECNQNPEWQYNQQRGQQQDGNICLEDGSCLQDMDMPETLSEAEMQGLAFMREEEKLARDVYKTLYEQWNTPIFANIAMSEQQHTDTVWQLMQSYELTDSATETVGVFNNPELQTLYDDLIARGQTSQLEALRVGALIEEVDIADLAEALEQTENPAIQTVYKNLLKGSENHLRAFVRNIENLGYTYEAQTLEAIQVDDILGTEEASSGFGINTNTMQLVATQTQFRPTISTDKGQRGNKLQVKGDEILRVGMTIEPDTQHLEQTADIINVATYQANAQAEKTLFMRDQQGQWQNWDGNFNNLMPNQAQQPLSQQQRINIHEGQLGTQGHFQINVGYRLNDGTLIFNGEPIEFMVE